MPTTDEIERRDRLGGLIHEYYRTAERVCERIADLGPECDTTIGGLQG